MYWKNNWKMENLWRFKQLSWEVNKENKYTKSKLNWVKKYNKDRKNNIKYFIFIKNNNSKFNLI